MCNNDCNHSFNNNEEMPQGAMKFFGFGFPSPKSPHPKFVAYCKEEFEKTNNPRFFGSKVLIHYLVDERNQRYGTFISYQDGKSIRFGWSICQTKLDKWDKYVGFHYAYKRSLGNITRIPRYIINDFDPFVERTLRYFKVDPENFVSNLGTPVTE